MVQNIKPKYILVDEDLYKKAKKIVVAKGYQARYGLMVLFNRAMEEYIERNCNDSD